MSSRSINVVIITHDGQNVVAEEAVSGTTDIGQEQAARADSWTDCTKIIRMDTVEVLEEMPMEEALFLYARAIEFDVACAYRASTGSSFSAGCPA